MKELLLIIFVGLGIFSFAQIDEVGPLTGNPQLQIDNELILTKAAVGTFDSTFIYSSDTLSMPVFDEFSTNRFQTYNAGYSDIGVTSILEYKLLDLASAPYSNDSIFTQQITFRRTYDVSTGLTTDEFFTPTQVQWGDQTSYPTSYTTIDAYPPFYIYDTVNPDNTSDTVWITGPEIFQDSARQFFAPVSDPELYWLDDEAYHNYTMAIDPWTLGVVTFDGLDSKGYPYAFGTTTSGIADHLTSKPIDMASFAASDSVYLSFLYQGTGYGDEPEPGDSLILEFYEKGTDQWNEIWKGGSTPIDEFTIGHIRIDSLIYFNDYFQFRFKNYGGLSGSLDNYHLDYVNLRSLSGYQDTLFRDFAWCYPINTLIKEFTSVPWDHYKNGFTGKMADSVRAIIRNGSSISENNSLAGSVEVSYGGPLEATYTLPGSDLANGDLNYSPLTTYYSYHDFSSGYHYDETKLGDSQEFDILGIASAQYPNFSGNDSTFSSQVFENYYSYDDGSAEKAYGPTGPQARLAIQYTPYENDSLIGALIHFVPSVNDVSNKLFLLTVWDDNNGVPGNVLYEDDAFFPRQPTYQYDRNVFTYYFLKDTMKLAINGTFYIGWRQFDADRLNVGLDMNIPNADKTFYSNDNGVSWDQSSFDGSVMIRPLFSTALDVTLGLEEMTETIVEEAKLYPNPTTGIVNIEFDLEYNGVEVFDLQGKQIIFTDEKYVDISTFNSGMYLFKLAGQSRVYKVFKQ